MMSLVLLFFNELIIKYIKIIISSVKCKLITAHIK